MTHQESNRILEGNRLIAEWMRWEFRPSTESLEGWISVYRDSICQFTDSPKFIDDFLIKGLRYHNDWNRLMEVVVECRKVQKEMSNKYAGKYSDLDDPTGWRAWSYHNVYLSTSIEDTYSSVLRFIEFCNNYTTKQSADE